MASPFDDVRLPMGIERGAEIGPRFQTSIITLTSGVEQRNSDWVEERLEANIGYGIMRDEYGAEYPEAEIDFGFRTVLNFFRARKGQYRGFRFRDWSDYEGDNVPIGTGNGANKLFQLKMMYGAYTRRITRPVADTVTTYVNGVEVPHTLGALGIVTLTNATAPANGAAITADFEFDVPVRFASDVQMVMLEWAKSGEIPDINLIGLRE